jgi:hypothetical protein
MKIDEGKYSIAEIVEWFKARQLVANPEYQRGGGLWPTAAKSYFIDTIVREFPFPKVYFHERLDPTTKRIRREIVDGQQRVGTIVAYVDGNFALGSNAREFDGQFFKDLDPEVQEAFLSYPVTVDVIRNAARADILQMFRRMNAFTLPLNAAEKRHSEFFGLFKDWVNVQLDRFGSMLVEWGVLTSRQIVRMADAEFVADLALAVEEGIVSTSPAKLRSLYNRYDKVFESPQIRQRVPAALEIVQTELSEVQGTYIVKSHVFHSLNCALIHNRFGLPGAEEATGLAPTGAYFIEPAQAVAGLRRLGVAHEEKEDGALAEYVQAASEGGNRATQRAIRIKWLCMALRGELPV